MGATVNRHHQAHNTICWLWRHPIAGLTAAICLYALTQQLPQLATITVALIAALIVTVIAWKIRLFARHIHPATWHRRRQTKRDTNRNWSNNNDRRALREDFAHWCKDAELQVDTRVIDWRRTSAGERWTLQTPPGFAAKAVLNNALNHIFARPGVLSISPTWIDLNTVAVEVRRRDPLSQAPAQRVATAATRDINEPVHIGTDEDGRQVTVALARHTLAAGASGTGKTNLIRSLISAAASSANGALAVVDPGGDLAMWEPMTRAYSNGDPAQAKALLEGVVTEMMGRADLLRAERLHNIAATDERPLLVVVVDEAPALVADRTHGKAIASALIRIAQEGRKFAVTLVLGVQHPRDDMLPVPVKLNMRNVLCFGVRSPNASDLVLGAGMAKEGFDASKISRVGQCWLSIEGSTPKRVQTVEVDPEIEREIVEGCAPPGAPGGAAPVLLRLAPPVDRERIGSGPEPAPLEGSVPEFVSQDGLRLAIWRQLESGPATRNELARRLGVHASTIVRQLRRMAEHGLVEGGEGQPWKARSMHEIVAS